MARIQYDPGTIGGTMIAQAVDHIRKAKDLLDRAKWLADQRSNGGADKPELVGCAEFAVGLDQGAVFYDAIGGLIFYAAQLTANDLAALDMGGT